MKKLRFLISLLCIQGAFAYDKTTVIEGLTFGVDRYNQHWLEVDDAHVPEEAAFSKAAQFLKQTKGKAIFVKKKPSAFEESLKALGFENFFSNNDGTEWILKNNSPIPLAFSATSGAQGIVIHDGKILLVEDAGRPGFYQFPGGGSEKDEFTSDTVLREVREEVGLETEIVKLVAHWEYKKSNRYGALNHGYFYVLKIKNGTSPLVHMDEKEIKSYGWFSLEDILGKKTLLPLNHAGQAIIAYAFGEGKKEQELGLKTLDPHAADRSGETMIHLHIMPYTENK